MPWDRRLSWELLPFGGEGIWKLGPRAPELPAQPCPPAPPSPSSSCPSGCPGPSTCSRAVTVTWTEQGQSRRAGTVGSLRGLLSSGCGLCRCGVRGVRELTGVPSSWGPRDSSAVTGRVDLFACGFREVPLSFLTSLMDCVKYLHSSKTMTWKDCCLWNGAPACPQFASLLVLSFLGCFLSA